jgi:hypothetical protein
MNGEVFYAKEFKELINYGNEILKTRPDLKNDIKGLLDLCQSEIEEGGSVEHEIELCREDMKQLTEE